MLALLAHALCQGWVLFPSPCCSLSRSLAKMGSTHRCRALHSCASFVVHRETKEARENGGKSSEFNIGLQQRGTQEGGSGRLHWEQTLATAAWSLSEGGPRAAQRSACSCCSAAFIEAVLSRRSPEVLEGAVTVPGACLLEVSLLDLDVIDTSGAGLASGTTPTAGRSTMGRWSPPSLSTPPLAPS